MVGEVELSVGLLRLLDLESRLMCCSTRDRLMNVDKLLLATGNNLRALQTRTLSSVDTIQHVGFELEPGPMVAA